MGYEALARGDAGDGRRRSKIWSSWVTVMVGRLKWDRGTTYALADASKLGSVAPNHVGRLEEVTAVITDGEPKPEVDAAIRRAIYPH